MLFEPINLTDICVPLWNLFFAFLKVKGYFASRLDEIAKDFM